MARSPDRILSLILMIVVLHLNQVSARHMDHFDCEGSHIEIEKSLNDLSIKALEAYIYLSLTPLALIGALILICSYFLYEEVRDPPGSILLGLSVTEFILSSVMLTQAINYFIYVEAPPCTGGLFCKINGYIHTTSVFMSFYYNCAFCVYVTRRMKTLFKNTTLSLGLFHLGSVFYCMSIVTYLTIADSIGKSSFGYCSIKACSNAAPIAIMGMWVVFFILSLATIYHFKKTLPHEENLINLKEEYFECYKLYMIATLVCWCFTCISYLLQLLNSYYLHNKTIPYIISIENITCIARPAILTILRFKDPILRRKILNSCRSFSFKRTTSAYLNNSGANINFTNFLPREKHAFETHSVESSTGHSEPMHFQNENSEIASSDINRKPTVRFEIESPTINNLAIPGAHEGGFLATLSVNMKTAFIYNILTGILISFDKIKFKNWDAEQSTQIARRGSFFSRRFSLNSGSLFKEKSSLNIIEEVKNYKELEIILKERNHLIQGTKVTAYAPLAFKELLEIDSLDKSINIWESLGLEENELSVEKSTKSSKNGGKSGEFFFFSHDSKFILKTVPNSELKVFRDSFEAYFNYLKHENPESLIAKIYGVFSYERSGLEPLHVILMRNISGCSSLQIEGIYDLKGSSYDRDILKGKEPGPGAKKVTLKDLDFLRMEERLKVTPNISDKIRTVLQRDALFFQKRGLIDYSLLVIKINKKKDYLLSGDREKIAQFRNPLFSLRSNENELCFYHIGIIDYLQRYDLKKRFEKYTKKILHFNKNLNTSSQNPEFYAKRFTDFIEKII